MLLWDNFEINREKIYSYNEKEKIMENKNQETFEGIPYSRFAASWHYAYKGTDSYSKGYRLMFKWLMTLTINGKRIDEWTARCIAEYAYLGKEELEENALSFLASEEA